MNLKKIIKVLHRDLGYICFGLIIVYSVSGIAVNHVDEWNPNYVITKTGSKITPLNDSSLTVQSQLDYVLTEMLMEDPVKSSFRPATNIIQIFFDNKTITANLKSGKVEIEKVESRHVFRESNFLHLNVAKKLWTYVADAFAASLILLAVTGLFMLNGKNGLGGRGKWLTLLGFLIPVAFLLLYF